MIKEGGVDDGLQQSAGFLITSEPQIVTYSSLPIQVTQQQSSHKTSGQEQLIWEGLAACDVCEQCNCFSGRHHEQSHLHSKKAFAT